MIIDTRSVNVEEVDNGWLVEWRKPREDGPEWAQAVVMKPPKTPPTNGRRIFTDKKELFKFLKGFI